MKAYSPDVRERVLRAVDQGIPRSEIVRVLGVSLATLDAISSNAEKWGMCVPKRSLDAFPRK